MAVNFCTMPTQHGKLGYFFPKLTAQLVSKNSNYIYVYIYLYLYKKTNNSSMLCINSSNSFSRFCSHLNKIVETSSTLNLKKKKKKKKVKNKTPENSTVLLLLWYLAPFFF